MTVVEKVQNIVGITPSYTDEDRNQIRAEARKRVTAAWFGSVLDHHAKIEEAFAAVKSANTATRRAAAQKDLAVILTGHSIAEEAIIYPFVKLGTSAMDATHAYTEQAVAKVEMVALDEINDKMSSEYMNKLEEIRGSVLHHMIEEERDFFPDLQDKLEPAKNRKITQHYQMEFDRYMSADKQ